jgi:CBS domain containing-hemolysin-like protein
LDKIVKSNNKNKKNGKGNSNSKWIITIIVWTILISGGVSLLSDMLLRNVNILVAFIILIFIISIGVIFDIIGVAVTAAEERPFHARASKKVPGAKIAVKLIRNADKVSNLCNDVVGDVCGIISGTTGAVIVAKIMKQTSFLNVTLLTAIIGALIAALTIGGKAWGKSFAIKQSEIIIDKVSKIIYIVKKER